MSMNKENKSFLINGVVSLVICFGIWSIPTAAPLTEAGVHALGILAGLVYGLCTIGYAVPSFVAIILLAFSGCYDSFTSAIVACFGNYIVTMLIGLLLFAGLMTHTGLARALAHRIVNAKAASGRPWVLTLMILLAAVIPSMFLNAIPVTIIVLDIVIGIFETLGCKKGDKWATIMMISIPGVAVFAQGVMPFQMGTATDYGILNSLDHTLTCPTGPYLASSFVILVVYLALVFITIRFLFRPDVTAVYNYKAPEKNAPFTSDQKRALLILIGFVFFLLVPVALPAGKLKSALAGLGTTGIAFAAVGAALMMRNKDGSPFITIREIADAGMHWDLLIMVAALNGICGCMTNSSIGISAWLSGLFSPMVSGLSPYAFFVVFMTMVTLATNVIDNIAVAFVSIPLMYTVTKSMGLSAVAFLAFTTHSAQFGLWLPASSPMSAVTYSKVGSGWVTRKSIMTYSLVFVLIYLICTYTVGYATISWF